MSAVVAELAGLSAAMTDKGPRYSVRLGEVADGLTRIPIAVLGRFVKGKLKFAITKATLADVVKNFRNRGVDTVIDYEHASEAPEMAAGGPVPASGWLKAIDDEPDGDGILWGHAEFTPRAKDLVKGGEYRYLSPVINWGARNKSTGEQQGATLTSIALTNRPFLEQLPAIAMTELGSGQTEARPAWRIDRGDAANEGREIRQVTKLFLTDRVARTVRVVTDDGAESTVTLEGLEAAPTVVRLSDVKRDKAGRLDFSALPQDGETLIGSDVLHAMRVQDALDEAMEDGKITAAQRPTYEKLALSDLDGFTGLIASMAPSTAVDLTERGLAGDGPTTSAHMQAAIDEHIAAIRKRRPELGYGDALRLVASERPELISLKGKLQRGGR
jgi:phage I-like protein